MSRDKNILKPRPDCKAAVYLHLHLGSIDHTRHTQNAPISHPSRFPLFLAHVERKPINARAVSKRDVVCPVLKCVRISVTNHVVCYNVFL